MNVYSIYVLRKRYNVRNRILPRLTIAESMRSDRRAYQSYSNSTEILYYRIFCRGKAAFTFKYTSKESKTKMVVVLYIRDVWISKVGHRYNIIVKAYYSR